MQSFNLKIVTASGIKFEGEANSVMVRSVTGDVSILAKHIDYLTALGVGKTVVTIGDEKKVAACCGGVLSILKNEATLLASTFEWDHEIDHERATQSLENAQKELSTLDDAKQIELAKLKIQRALTRIEVKKG